ncbi:MAG TPA: V-type ATP synthase subunit A [Gaiellaceae bacterium]|nr:V-type ATP synthase subunit A [Gaiellaceae bacterium]HYA09561.1 V-type ATP synthase subunit A [Gaiellaceae bacterium]
MELKPEPRPAVVRVNGPVVEAEGVEAAMLDFVEVGPKRLPGEVIALSGDRATVQVYEYTGGLRPGDPILSSGGPLSAELGPGLLGGVFDGMLRRLTAAGDLLASGTRPGTLPSDRRWPFSPAAGVGDELAAAGLLGVVPETETIEHRVLVPPGISGRVESVAPAGEYTVDEPVAVVGGHELSLAQRWPVRQPRPFAARLPTEPPIRTGQRVLDLFYPVARGSSAGVPGGFGTGKTVLLQQIAKWCDADVIVYVGCGERGNEMADVLGELPRLEDPRTGRSLLERTVLIANVSNMPVMAREASIHTGVTVAEYYRDMGHDVVLIADSTSRWAEALREVASRTDELPAEEGYPAGLASALASFYERAGRVRMPGGTEGSVTIVGAVSPPGGDLAEPVSAHTRRFVRCVWSLDRDLAYARHYPAVSWRDSSSRDAEAVGSWHALEGDWAWRERRTAALRLLAEADRIESVAQLVGAGSLPDDERVVLVTARLLREAVLQQSSLSENDAYCAPEKQAALLQLVLDLHERCLELLRSGVTAAAIEEVDLSDAIRAPDETRPDDAAEVDGVRRRLLARLGALR